LGGIVSQIAVAVDGQGLLEVFGIGTDGAVWYRIQDNPGDNTDGTFSTWASMGGIVSQFVVGQNNDAGQSLQIFGIGTDNALWTNEQQADGSYSVNNWQSLGGIVQQVAVGQNLNGFLQVFGIGNDNAVWTREQTAQTAPNVAAQYTAWQSLGGIVAQITTGQN